MNKYKVEVFANVGNYEIIEAKNETEAKELLLYGLEIEVFYYD